MKNIKAAVTEPTLKEQWAAARHSSDWERIKLRIGREIAANEAELETLKAGRVDAAVEGRTAAHNATRRQLLETIEGQKAALSDAEFRRDAMETRELQQAKIAGSTAAAKKGEEIQARYVGVHERMRELVAELVAIDRDLDDMDTLQIHAIRSVERGNQADRSLITPRARVIGQAAAKCKRPVLGAAHAGPMSEQSAIQIQARILVERLQKTLVHTDEHDAKRNDVLVNLRQSPAHNGAVVVDPTSMGGKPAGGYGRGVS